MKRYYRFYEIFDGGKVYFTPHREPADRKDAGLFTEADWIRWGSDSVLREEIGEDEAMRLIGAPTLPGLGA